MRAKSASTSIVDPYRAGVFLGRSLSEIKPEIVFLFATVQYDNMSQLTGGLYDGLGEPSTRVIGATGDGIYEWQGVADVGAAVLGIATEGTVAWHVASGSGASTDPEGAVREALFKVELALEGRDPAFFYLVSDSLADGSRIESIIQDEIQAPVIGGMSGDDNSKVTYGWQFKDHQALRDSVVLLAVDGSLPFQVHACNSFLPVGSPGLIEAARGGVIERISGVDAVAFVEQQMGKPVLPSDQGIALVATDPQHPRETRLRAFKQDYSVGGTLMLRGSIAAGGKAQVCVTEPADLQLEMKSLASRLANSTFNPFAALIVSCSGRKWLSGGDVSFELEAIANAMKKPVPLAGFPSYGEFTPLFHESGRTRNLFHNMTFVLLLLGH